MKWLNRFVAGLGCLLGILAISLVPQAARALPPPIKTIPVERLVENLNKYTEEHPEQSYGWLRLARVHVFAYVFDKQAMEDTQWLQPTTFVGTPKELPASRDTAAGKKHAQEAFRAFDRSMKCEKNYPLAWVGRGYLLEQSADDIDFLPTGLEFTALPAEELAAVQKAIAELASPVAANRETASSDLTARGQRIAPVLLQHRNHESVEARAMIRKLLTRIWREAAIADYRTAWEKAAPEELKNAKQHSDVWTLVAHAASVAYKRMVTERGAAESEEKLIKTMDTHIESIKASFGPRPPISPIVFSLTAAKPLAALVDANSSVAFDLDGDWVAERRQWVQPDTAILCWDPGCEGKITSGRQLFGNVTWWIFWNNGYEALDALDDNRDGELTGAELTGLAVWRDADQNGVSDPGEVLPVVNVNVASISCRAPETEDGCPANRRGLRLTDGRALPTYDWYSASPAEH